jgi:hypothetical protein
MDPNANPQPRRAMLYGVFGTVNGTARWAMLRNKRRAVRLARLHSGYVTATPEPGCAVWDAPTFRVCSDLVADFRPDPCACGQLASGAHKAWDTGAHRCY